MTIFSIDAKLSDILFADPAVLPLLNRFGIRLGVGNCNITEAAHEAGVDPALMLAVVNTFFNEDYFPEELFRTAAVTSLLDYLRKTDAYYGKIQLPNIERHFNRLIPTSDSQGSNLRLLSGFFMEFRKELLSRIEVDDTSLFPAVENGRHLPEDEVEEFLAADAAIEDKISDLLTFFVVHLKGEYDMNLCNAVIQAIFTLRSEIRRNNRIRRIILFPALADPRNHD